MRATFLNLISSTSASAANAAVRARPRPPPPKPGAAKIVKDLLLKHGSLTVQQIFDFGTEGHPRAEPVPKQLETADGKVMMKKRANVRGGKSPLQPMPTAPFPDHPFVSRNYLKSNVLTTLADSCLIHLERILVPHRNAEERAAALKLAARMNMRRQRKASEQKLPPPELVKPYTETEVYVWKLGPAPERDVDGQGVNWNDIHQYEAVTSEAKAYELERIAERRALRKLVHREEKYEMKAERRRDQLAGREEEVMYQKELAKSNRGLRQYAAETGHDVSRWE